MKKILIADDDEQLLISLKNALSNYYQVDVAFTASETLRLLEEKVYDGLIIDVDFKSGISGIETIEIIREWKIENLKIIVFSAIEYSNSVRQRIIELGAVFYEKPLTDEKIRNVFEDEL